MKYFENLAESEITFLEDVLPHIAVLVAGADDEIDEDEQRWASKLTHIRSFANQHKELLPFYEQVATNFKIRFNDLLKKLPEKAADRNPQIEAHLSGANEILAKLDPKIAYALYHSFVTFAKRMAEVSGGLFGFGAISAEESKAIKLQFLNPIAEPPKKK